MYIFYPDSICPLKIYCFDFVEYFVSYLILCFHLVNLYSVLQYLHHRHWSLILSVFQKPLIRIWRTTSHSPIDIFLRPTLTYRIYVQFTQQYGVFMKPVVILPCSKMNFDKRKRKNFWSKFWALIWFGSLKMHWLSVVLRLISKNFESFFESKMISNRFQSYSFKVKTSKYRQAFLSN